VRPGYSTAIACLGLATSVARAEPAWKTYATQNGITFEKRAVEGSKFLEYRASVRLPLDGSRVIGAIWAGVLDAVPSTVKKRVVVSRTDREIVVYDQIKTPVVSDRDVTIRIRKLVRSDGGGEIPFESTTAIGPPPDPKHVRIPMVRGSWSIAPAPDGSTVLTYLCYSEPGGSIPAFLARGAQQDQIALDLERILRRLSNP
jgi:hypothetical protein